MSFSSDAAQYDVKFTSNVGAFRAEMGEVGAVYARTTGQMSSESLRAASAHERLQRTIKRYGPESERAKIATVAYRKEMAALAHDAGRTNSALEREERTLGRVGRGALAGSGALNHLGRAAIFASSSVLGGYGLVYALKAVVNEASTVQEETEKTSVVFGKSAGDVQAWAKTLALSFGISEAAALRSTGVFGNMLRPLHFGEQDAARMSKRLVELAADLASFNNAKPDEVLQALSSGIAGQVRPLRQYGVFLSQARIQEEAYADGIAKRGQKLSQAQKIQASYNIILKDTKQAQGDVARNTGSLSVAQSKLNAELQDSEATIGQDLRPELAHLANTAAVYLDHLNSTGQLQRDVNKAMRTGGEIVHGVGDAFHTAHDLLSPLNDLLGGTRATVRDLGLAFLLLRARALLGAGGILKAGAAAVTAEGEMAGAAGTAGTLGTKLTALTAAPWVLTVLVAYQDIKDPGSIKRRAQSIFDVIKRGGAIEQGLESLPTVGPVIAAIHAATNAAGKGTPLPPGQSPIGENALGGGGGHHAKRPTGSGDTTPHPLGLIARFAKADTALAKAEAEHDVAAQRAVLLEQEKLLHKELASSKKAFRDKASIYRQLTSVEDAVAQIDADAAAKRKDAADKRAAEEKKRAAAEKRRRDARARAAREREQEARRTRAARIDLLTHAPVDDEIAIQEAIAAGASTAKLLKLYEKELRDQELNIRVLEKLNLGKKAELAARKEANRIRSKIHELQHKQKTSGQSIFAEAAEEFRLYGSNIARRDGLLSPQDARGDVGRQILTEMRKLNRHAESTAHSTGKLTRGRPQSIEIARALAHQGL